MVALVASTLIAVIMAGGIEWYAKRRPAGAPVTWAEAMVGSVYVFFVMFLVFGVVPHQWLTLAENEWSFRADRLFDAGGLIKAKSQGGWFPFEVTLRVVSDSIAAIIYIVFLGGLQTMWGRWQKRGDRANTQAAAIPKSAYGRPLVRKG
ncbi:MAG: hypothetical protein ACI8TP_004554 [Acidimicrobiales bacterium]